MKKIDKKEQKDNKVRFFYKKSDSKGKCKIIKHIKIVEKFKCPQCGHFIPKNGNLYQVLFESIISYSMYFCRKCLSQSYKNNSDFCIVIPENYTPVIINHSKNMEKL